MNEVEIFNKAANTFQVSQSKQDDLIQKLSDIQRRISKCEQTQDKAQKKMRELVTVRFWEILNYMEKNNIPFAEGNVKVSSAQCEEVLFVDGEIIFQTVFTQPYGHSYTQPVYFSGITLKEFFNSDGIIIKADSYNNDYRLVAIPVGEYVLQEV